MSAGKALVASTIVGVVLWALREHAKTAGGARVVKVTTETEPERDRGALIDGIFGALSAFASGDDRAGREQGQGVLWDILGGVPVLKENPGVATLLPGGIQTRTGSASSLLALIRSVEAPRGYDDYYRGVSAPPPRALTTMTVGEVLAWQDRIDASSPSEAAGAYQILEDTLRDLVAQGHARTDERFSPAVQDRLALALLERRGLSRYRAGKLSAEGFANNIAKEWASMPVVTGPKAGRSYYAGDGLNKSLVSPAQVLQAVRVV